MKNWRTASSELHRVLGVWALVFNFILAFSGFWMIKSALDVSSHFAEAKVSAPPAAIQSSIDAMYFSAKSMIPNLTVNYISLPRKKGDALKFFGDVPGNSLYGEFSNSVEFDPSTGALLKVTKETEIPKGEKFEQLLSTLHFGGYGGKIIKIVYSLFGLVTASIAITGYILWWRRNVYKTKKPGIFAR